MRNAIENEVPVGANERRKVHVAVINPQVITLSDEPLDDLDDWAFTEIICSRLEAESQDSNTRISAFDHKPDSTRNLHFIAGKNRAQNGKLEIVHFCLI